MLRALTLIQPWAYAVCHLGKTIENRTWPPPSGIVGQHLAIHAGKKFDEDDADAIRNEFGLGVPDVVPVGAIVAVVRVAGAERVRDELAENLGLPAQYATRWSSGPWCWLLADLVVLPHPVECRGKQGLWPVEGCTLDMVREEWRAGRGR